MRDLTELDALRRPVPDVLKAKCKDPHTSGVFQVQLCKRTFLAVATVDGFGDNAMEHVSVSHRNGKIMPSWDEMCALKDLFFLPEEECIQIHPKKSEYVNMVGNCLHLWRNVRGGT